MGTAQRSGDAAIRPRALDLFCGGGGASMGLHRSGFDVVGHVTSHGWSMVYGGGSRRQGRNKMPEWQAAMGIDWLPRRALAQAIPPAYSELIGLEAMAAIRRRSNGEHSYRAASLGAV